MSMSAQIDLSALPAPEVIETISYEEILAQKKALFGELYDGDVLDLESEPVIKLLEVAAYQEMHLRQEMNDKAKALLLAFAGGANLDHLGANVAVERAVLEPGDTSVVPALDPVLEEDPDFKRRVQLAPEAITTAGSEGAYLFHALSAGDQPTEMNVEAGGANTVIVTYHFGANGFSARIRDARATSPHPTEVTVYVLSQIGDGAVDAETLVAVRDHLTQKSVRPLTDLVTVSSATIKNWDVKAVLDLYDGPDPALVLETVTANFNTYKAARHKLGESVTESGLHAVFHIAGVKNVTLSKGDDSAWEDVVCALNEAPYCTAMEVTTS